jgi:carbon monoxide dehydrogenase subunit G
VKLQGSHTYDTPRAIVWQALMDPAILAGTLPGCEELQADADGSRLRGKLTVRIGPIQGTFLGAVQMSALVPPESFHLHVEGSGAPGFLKGDGAIRLEDTSGGTVVRYDLDVHVGGRLASVGQRLLDSTARAMTRQALDGLGCQLVASTLTSATGAATPGEESGSAASPVGSGLHSNVGPGFSRIGDPPAGIDQSSNVRSGLSRMAADPAARAATAPSQGVLAARVARDVVNDLVPPQRRRQLMVGMVAAAAIAWIVWRIVS